MHEVRAPQQKSFGEVPEWSNGADSKSVDRVIGPGVRIPPSPPYTKEPASAGFFVYGGEGSPMRTPGFDNLAQRDWTPQRSEGAPQGRENATSVFESIPRWSLVRSREVSAGFFVYGGEGSPMRTPGFDNLAQRDWTPQRSEGAPQGRENATSVFESIPRWSLVRSREVSAGFFVYGGEGSPMRTPGGLSDLGTIYCAGRRASPNKLDSSLHRTTMRLEIVFIWTRPPTMLATIA